MIVAYVKNVGVWCRLQGWGLRLLLSHLRFPGGSVSKESACNVGDLGSVPGWGRSPGGGHDNPLQHSCLENPHGQRSLAGYSPWGHKELDTTERLSRAQGISRCHTAGHFGISKGALRRDFTRSPQRRGGGRKGLGGEGARAVRTRAGLWELLTLTAVRMSGPW